MRLHEMVETKSVVDAVAYKRNPVNREIELEHWLHQNPELLLDEQILLVGRQVRLETGVADLVGLDRWGNVVIFEVKIGRSGSGSASEETILSQPQNYAQSLSSFAYSDLNELYHEYTEQMTGGAWNVVQSAAGGGSLQSVHSDTFGDRLEEHQFNTEQRMVIIAEEITQRTERNARYLLKEGLNFQCVEIQAFDVPDDENRDLMLASSTIVDYPPGRVRPKDRPSPTYPALVNDILERAYPQFQSVTNAGSVSELFPEGFDKREPELVSRNDDHPIYITYRIAPKPDDGTVVIAIDARGDSVDAVSELQEMQAEFAEQGLDVTGNQTYRVVARKWELEDAEGLNEEILDEIAEQYATLVRMGHKAFMTT